MEISTTDMILRELMVIDKLFRLQFVKYNVHDPFDTPDIFNEKMERIDGRYIAFFEIRSTNELLNLQKYKIDIEKRFDGAKNPSLLERQLMNIRSKALAIMDYYNVNLTEKAPIVKTYLEGASFETPKRINHLVHHSASVFVGEQYNLTTFLGIEGVINAYGNNGVHQYPQMKAYYDSLVERSSVIYHCYNSELAEYCSRWIAFIDVIVPPPPQHAKKTVALNLSTRQHALYYYFLFESNTMDWYNGEKKSSWAKDVSIEINRDATALIKKFNEISNPQKGKSSREEGTASNVSDMEIVCSMLDSAPSALFLAENALNAAKNNLK